MIGENIIYTLFHKQLKSLCDRQRYLENFKHYKYYFAKIFFISNLFAIRTSLRACILVSFLFI